MNKFIQGGRKSFYFVNGKKLEAVGYNDQYQLGQGDTDDRSEAVEIKIPGNPRVVRFKNGVSSSTVIVLTTKGIYGCGCGDGGQFGNGSIKHRTKMKEIEFYRGKQIRDYFSEGGGVWVILSNQTIFRGGDNYYRTLGNGTRDNVLVPEVLDKTFLRSQKEIVVDIKSYEHTLLLTDQGFVYTCGSGSCGKSGIVSNDESWFEEIKMFLKKKEKVVLVAAGCRHSLFVTSNDVVYSCGSSEFGQLGHNDSRQRTIPTRVNSLQKKRIKKICCGWDFSLFFTAENWVFGCGENDSYQTGVITNKLIFPPSKIKFDMQIIDVATALFTTILLTSSGDVYTIGSNKKGQCCLGNLLSPVSRVTKTKMKLEMRSETLFEKGKPTKLSDSFIITLW